MRRIIVLPLALLAFVWLGGAVAAGPEVFRAHLTGDEEVPPVSTRAHGQAVFRLDRDATAIHYQLMLANITDVSAAHIHMAPAGVNGAVVVWLYPHQPPSVLIPGQFQGVLAAGAITEANLTGALAGQTLEDLLAAMRDGQTYVNVHTAANPGGEVRGQIR